MNIGSLEATLGVNSEGLRRAEGDLRSFGSTADSTFSRAGGSALAMGAQILAIVGGVYALERAFKAGIKAVDDFNLSTIGAAATITDMAKDQSKGQENYTRALVYSKDMYQELELAAARYFASGQEMTQAWNILTQKGIVLRKEEIDSLGVIVDRIKLSTQGQTSSLQIAQEMRSIITGQARVTDQVGMLLKDRIPDLEAELKKHREIGDVVKWLGDQFKGLAYASKDIQDTLESQNSTLGTLLTQVGRGGLAGAYSDIVEVLKQINDYLTVHKGEISGGIAKGWQAVKDLAGGVYGFVQAIANIANKGIVVPITFAIGGATKLLAGGAGPMGDFGFGALDQTKPELDIEAKLKQNRDIAKQVDQYKRETFELYSKSLGAPAVTAPIGKEPKGGGGAEAEINRLNSLFDTLTKDIARLSEGKLSAIEADYVKTVENIYKKSSDRAHSEAELEILAKTRSTLQKGKLQDDFDLKMAKGSGDAFLEINEQYKKDLLDFGGLAGTKEKLDAFYGRQRVIKETERVSEVLNLQKTYMDAMASASSIITDQLTWKKQSLDLENQLAQAAIAKTIAEKPYLAFLEDEMRAQQALINQAKQYALAREFWRTEGWQGGLKMGLVDAQNTAATWQADQVASFLKSAPQAISQQMASSFIGYLQGKKTDFDALAWSMGEKLIQTQLEGFLTQLLPQAIQGLMQLLGIKLPAELTAAQTAATVLIGGGVGAGQAMIAAAITAASILSGKGGTGMFSSSAGSGANDILSGFDWESMYSSGGYHSGGHVRPIYAHKGLAPHEVLITALDTERVLNPDETRGYEAGLARIGGNGGGGRFEQKIIINNNVPDSRAKAETQPGGDIIITLDPIMAKVYNRGGQFAKAINAGSGATKR